MTDSLAPPAATFLPDMCGVRTLFGVVIVGELLAVVLTLVTSGFGANALDRLSLMSLFIQWIGLSATASLCLSRVWMGRLPETVAALASYILILIVVLVISEVVWWWINPLSGEVALVRLAHADFLARTMGISAIVGALVLRYFYLQHRWKQRTLSEAQARLEALQARIRPHFLFNCMNTIASLTRTDPAAAERAVEDLADLFRASFAEARTLVSLEEELELVNGYLNIEGLRLGGRLRTEWNVCKPLPGCRLPLLTLQPLVENAIYHGIEPLEDGGTITLSIAAAVDHLTIVVSNPLATGKASHRRGNRLAQENVRQRLAAHFGDRGTLDVRTTAETYEAVISIPIGE